MLFKWTARIIVFGAYAAVCAYAVIADTGPIGWINYAQQSVFGSYSQKLTMTIAILVSMVVLVPLWIGIEALGKRLGVPDALPKVPQPRDPTRTPSKRGFLLSSFVAIPLIWAGGYAIWWYYQHQHQQDAAAAYEPVQLLRDKAPAPATPYLAIEGKLLWERTVALTKGSSNTLEYTLVPMVPEGWHEGETVKYIARVDSSNRYLAERATRHRERILAHIDGAVAVPAAQEFLKLGVPTDESTRSLRLIASENGAPAIKDTAESDWQIYLWLGSGGSVLYVFMMGVVALGITNAERKRRKQALKRR